MEFPKSPIHLIVSVPNISDQSTRCKNDTGSEDAGRLNKAQPFREPAENVRGEPHSEIVRAPIPGPDVNGWPIQTPAPLAVGELGINSPEWLTRPELRLDVPHWQKPKETTRDQQTIGQPPCFSVHRGFLERNAKNHCDNWKQLRSCATGRGPQESSPDN